MTEPVLNEVLLKHLVDEFGSAGSRSVEFLQTAQKLVHEGGVRTPRDGSLIAYALREALKGLAVARSSGEGGEWKVRSREVVTAKDNLVAARALDQEAGDEALYNLLRCIERLAEVHEQESVHVRRMSAIIVERSGVEPLRGKGPVDEFQDLLGDLDQGLHGLITLDSALDLWRRSVAVLSRLFLPPQERFGQLDSLALVSEPSSQDSEQLLAILVGPNHLRHFLQKIENPRWIDLLLAEGDLLKPSPTSAGWPAASVFSRLASSHGEVLAAQLRLMNRKWGSEEPAAWQFAIAGLELGEYGQPVLLECLQQHRRSRAISSFAVNSACRNDKSCTYVMDVADIVLSREAIAVDSHSSREIMDALVQGATSSNILERARLICYKLKRLLALREYNIIDYDHSTLGRLRSTENGPFDPVVELVDRFVELIRAAIATGHNFEALDALINVFEAPFLEKARAWLISELGNDIELGVRIDFIRTAIASRGPTADDKAIIQEVCAQAEAGLYEPQWTEVLPSSPEVREVGEALASGSLDPRWREMFRWYAILPRNLTTSWASAIAVLSGRFGEEPTEALFEARFDSSMGGALWGSSPISVSDLSEYTVEQAVLYLREWRPDPTRMMESARELGRSFEVVVKNGVLAWGEDPLQRAIELHHPTYIHHYLNGLTAVESADEAEKINKAKLADLVDLVFTSPWPAPSIGSDPFEFDQDWRPAQQAGISLIRKLAELRVGLDSAADRFWSQICSAVRDRTDVSHIGGESEYLERAINRPCTRALETAIHFIAAENARGLPVRREFLIVLDEVLALEGIDGAEFRAVISPRLRFLDRIIQDWVIAAKPRLVGDEAPGGLGQVSVDMSVKWGTPPDWLLIEYRSKVETAVEQDVENAVDHYIISFLRELDGYSQRNVLSWLLTKGKLGAATESLGRALGMEGATEGMARMALALWDSCIAEHSASAYLFGELYRATVISDDSWLERVSKTLSVAEGAISSPEQVMERLASMDVSEEVIGAADRVVRSVLEPWERYSVERTALAIMRALDSSARESAAYRRLEAAMLERGHEV